MGAPPALKNYHAWLYKNNFSYETTNPTNEVVAPFYGVGPLWKTEYSQGIVVKAEDDDDYYIVMECSSKIKDISIPKLFLRWVDVCNEERARAFSSGSKLC